MDEGAEHRHPARLDMAVFAMKANVFRMRRGVMDLAGGQARRLKRVDHPGGELLSEVVTKLYTDDSLHERALQLGKVQNLRVAAKRLNGLIIPQGRVFSFWAHIGRPTRAKGFVEGRELRQGCIIPTLAGGLCQMSNSLYRAAKEAGCEIVERHGHTAEVPGSPFPPGEDATVFWNYVDLRFRSTRDMAMSVRLDRDDLIVRLVGA
jgi:vancomycin resistance protein YoaR